jgi:hypothetical protein
MKYIIVVILFFFLSGCRKEGLSKDTGNLEITIPTPYQVSWEYAIFNGEQFLLFLNYEYAIPIRSGRSFTGLINEKGLKEGAYGLHIYSNSTAHKRSFSIEAGKVTKLKIP